MTKAQYVGINGVARKVKQPYVGINGVARKIKTAYVGINGIARKYFGKLVTFGFWTGNGASSITINEASSFNGISGNSLKMQLTITNSSSGTETRAAQHADIYNVDSSLWGKSLSFDWTYYPYTYSNGYQNYTNSTFLFADSSGNTISYKTLGQANVGSGSYSTTIPTNTKTMAFINDCGAGYVTNFTTTTTILSLIAIYHIFYC